jgi:hypothetical protein
MTEGDGGSGQRRRLGKDGGNAGCLGFWRRERSLGFRAARVGALNRGVGPRPAGSEARSSGRERRVGLDPGSDTVGAATRGRG